MSRFPEVARWGHRVVGSGLALCAGLVDLIYPQECCGCATPLIPGAGTAFCPSCMTHIRTVQRPWCATCGAPFDRTIDPPRSDCPRCLVSPRPFRRARSWAYYSTDRAERNPLARALWALKYERRADLGGRLGRLLAVRCPLGAGEHDLVIPVPLHRERLRWRGFNHAYLLAVPIARHLALPLAPGAVRRSRPTPPQVSLPPAARLANVRGAFVVHHPRRVVRKRVLLIDDVYTTGATAAACADALARAGAACVDVFTAARAVSP